MILISSGGTSSFLRKNSLFQSVMDRLLVQAIREENCEHVQNVEYAHFPNTLFANLRPNVVLTFFIPCSN
jgi:hypothetical protein